MTRRTLITLAWLLGGCSSDFLPPSYLDGLRVLAVPASPLEAGPGDQVTLRPVVYLPDDEQLTLQRWTFCPFNLGSSAGYRCAVPACERPLTVASDGSVSTDPSALAAQCAARLAASGLTGLAPGQLPEVVQAVFLGTHGSSSGLQRTTALQLPLYLTAAPSLRNRPPVITRVSLDGQPLAEGQPFRAVQSDEQLPLRVELDASSLDAFVDEAGRQRTEDALISFFTTAGRFEYDRDSGTDVTNTFQVEQLEPGQTAARLYIVARDLRGGQTVAGPFVVPFR